MRELSKGINQTHEAIAAVFCSQVLRKPLDDSFPEHDRRALLGTFGIDVDALSDLTYSKELIGDRLRVHRENINNLCARAESVLKDADFELIKIEQAGQAGQAG